MEERIIEKDDERLIRIKKTAEGGTDAEDALTDEKEESEEEVLVTLPEGEEEYDEDLVGLTPSQLAKELERRKKAEEEARAECAKLVAEAEALLEKEEYDRAASYFAQATCYSFADERIVEGLWLARTKNFTDLSPFCVPEYAEELASYEKSVKAGVRGKMQEELKEERKRTEEEIGRISPSVLEKQEERRQAFRANRKYYLILLLAFLGVMALLSVAAGVSASYIVRTLSLLPVILTAVFGGLALIAFVTAFCFYLKFSGAHKLCRVNEKLSSTEEGARLEKLQEKRDCLVMVLEDEEE